jgi:transposase
VDTSGLLLAVWVTAASVSDVLGGKLVLLRAAEFGVVLRRVWADFAYRGLANWAGWPFRCVAEVVRRRDGERGFRALPRRWVVERTFGWLTRHRRLARDYERTPESSEAFIYVAMTRIMLRRLYPA